MPHPLRIALVFFGALSLPFSPLMGAPAPYEPRLKNASSVEVYKQAPQRELVINIYRPKENGEAVTPAIIFYSGGGWVHADTAHFQRQARHYAAQGYTVFLPDYRVRNRDKTGVAECVEDATDAYRWVLDNAERLGVDPDQIILGGGSAGGHLALAVTLLHPELPTPDAFLVYNPVTQTTQGGYYTPGAYLDRSNIAKVSLHDKVRGGLPPLLIQHGEADHVVPYDNSRSFAEAWAAQGNQVKLIGYPGADHGFFNKGEHYTQTVAETDRFLDALHNEKPDASTTSVASAPRPNILFILADDMGYSDPGFLGGDIHTPNLDRLAAQGTVFTRFTNHSKCEPSRASLMTGVHFQRQTHDHVVRRFENVTTFAQLLSDSGYTTLISGKWHLPESPIERGFDHFFGLLGGASNHFDPTARLGMADDLYLHRELMLDDEAYEVVDDDFYTTNAFTDHALAFLAKKPADKPFFLYLAYTAPHWPLQAPEETIKRYEDRYNEGWQKLQAARFKNMQANGWASKDWKLPDMPDSTPAWEDYDQHADAARSMAVHAAMVDQMDQQIGRVLDYLTETDQLDNTLVLFTSDNGAAGVIGPEKRFDRTPGIPAGPVESFRMLPEGFVHAVNSPYREQKLSQLSGGNTSPLIAFWPEHTTAGRIVREPVNILDFFPTFLELAGVAYPDGITELDGESFYPALVGGSVPERSPQFLRLVYVEADEHAVISAPWKLYRSDAQDWQLFNLEKDGTETNDLSQEEPSITQSLKTSYETFSSTLPHKK